jgi:hypothetical protein
VPRSKNLQKRTEIRKNARVSSKNEQEMRGFWQKITGHSGLSTSAIIFGRFWD